MGEILFPDSDLDLKDLYLYFTISLDVNKPPLDVFLDLLDLLLDRLLDFVTFLVYLNCDLILDL